MIRCAVGFALGSLVVACAAERDANARVSVPQLAVGATPLVDIAGSTLTGAVVLESVVGGTRFDDGTIAIADGLAPAVRYFGPDGQLIKTVGRDGSGPGEFRMLSWLGRCGADEVWVWDFVAHRITVLDASGALVRVESWEDGSRPPARFGCSRTGVLATVGRPDLTTAEGSDYQMGMAPLHVRDTSGNAIRVMEAVPIIEWAVDAGHFRPLSWTTYVAVTEDAMFVNADSGAVAMYAMTGGLRATFDLHIPLRQPMRSHVERAADEQAMWMSDADARGRLWNRLVTISPPAYLQPIAGLHADPSGVVWAVLSYPGDSVTTIRGVTRRGEIVGDVTLPKNMWVWEVGQDHVLGSYEAEDTGEPHVAVYRFTR